MRGGQPESASSGDAVPSWLRPFTYEGNARFTRTPDRLLRTQAEPVVREAPQPDAAAADEAELPSFGYRAYMTALRAAFSGRPSEAGESAEAGIRSDEPDAAENNRDDLAPLDEAAGVSGIVLPADMPHIEADGGEALDVADSQDVGDAVSHDHSAATSLPSHAADTVPPPRTATEPSNVPASVAPMGEEAPAAAAEASPVFLSDAENAPPSRLAALRQVFLLGASQFGHAPAVEQDLLPPFVAGDRAMVAAMGDDADLAEDELDHADPADDEMTDEGFADEDLVDDDMGSSERDAVFENADVVSLDIDHGEDTAGDVTVAATAAGGETPTADDAAALDRPSDTAPDTVPSVPAFTPAFATAFSWRPYAQTVVVGGFSLSGGLAPAVPAPVVTAALSQPEASAQAPSSAEDETAEDETAGPAAHYELPDLSLLNDPPEQEPDFELSEAFLDQNSTALQQILRDFGVRGEVIDANPGPVVTLYEFEPAPGVKSSRVIGLAGDIARSMSAISVRVAIVPGRNVIGIELPNRRRNTVWLRELLASQEYAETRTKLGICLGKTIGGEPLVADLARMPHLLVAGTTGSGKSVAINTMILSLLYRHTPDQCRLIMIDPKMLELSVYEGIPHLLTPVVTDPRKAIIALKWAVKEMEERYRKMARLAVRNIDGYNVRMAEARAKGEVITRQVQVGFDKESGEILYEDQEMDLAPLPYIVIIVDEMADLMMVAGKEIEGAIQRLAQMARAAGIHLVMATQRPSVDVITGTIKANFPTRISFQVTSKIDSRTILGEMGAETLLGQGDMLFMAGGGRITRIHGPFVSDAEVEHVVAFLKTQGGPEYLDEVVLDEEADGPPEADEPVFDKTVQGSESTGSGGDLYDQAVAIVLRDRKASTSYIQRRLQVGYNKAASIMERMEEEGIVGPANHAGKREILMSSRPY
ncbi:DNA translocase FtsK [Pseudoxanthobacter soli DSM 19599]|uniref:DNA translocase FtsK n=1 Tax=Pseudoxanthobacter soli DSM 19599 TaxID=1123029 RepID=A0A1M7ZPQ2_9HYPH|nr:DNA translocase FtsK [Pseudoxanthobacter soli]SHO66875.1 DNA translocase FtsK [Pseudoxanthobacter soli DSM 19599]